MENQPVRVELVKRVYDRDHNDLKVVHDDLKVVFIARDNVEQTEIAYEFLRDNPHGVVVIETQVCFTVEQIEKEFARYFENYV